MIEPDATGKNKVIAWTQSNIAKYIFVVNLDLENKIKTNFLDGLTKGTVLFYASSCGSEFKKNDVNILPTNFLEKAECRIYKI